MHPDRPCDTPYSSRPQDSGRWSLPTLEADSHPPEPADDGNRPKPVRRGGSQAEREQELIGGFSRTSAMPWLSWSIPADLCKLGSRLWDVPGSVCEGCYARTRHYRQRNVVNAMERRYSKLADLNAWTENMVRLLRERATRFRPRPNDRWPAFRWHDSGDLQSAEHLLSICMIADRTQDVLLADGSVQDVRYWLPSREYGYVREVRGRREIPRNLCVRLSAHMVDGPVPTAFSLPVSSVHTRPDQYPDALVCPAFTRGGGCQDCRSCWDASVPHVSYPAH